MNKTNFKNIAVSSLTVNAKDILLNQLKTGDIIKVKSEILPIIYHYGIVLKNESSATIFHNDPFFLNRKGGNIINEDLASWLVGKEIVEVTSTNVNETELKAYIAKIHSEKYHWFNFNCEHFVYNLKSKNVFSAQVVGYSIIAASIILGAIIVFKKNKK